MVGFKIFQGCKNKFYAQNYFFFFKNAFIHQKEINIFFHKAKKDRQNPLFFKFFQIKKNHMRIFIFLLFSSLCFPACTPYKPKTAFQKPTASAPDYSKKIYWAALPTQPDNADRVPDATLFDRQAQAEVDVFFLHPTTYTGHRGETKWNAPFEAPKLNARTDAGTILHQASIFNGAGKIYAPRYRQAHLHAYYTKDQASAKAAFELAYSDVRNAFLYYLENYNEGRPIIIASHSQGTNHATLLLKEFFDGKKLNQQLVAAYLVGMPIQKDEFQNIPLCQNPEDIQCFCSWRTFKKGYLPKNLPHGDSIGVTNPLLWLSDESYADFSLNKGGILRNFDKGPKPGLTDARVKKGILWAAKPRFFGKIFITFKNYHIADFNLYYMNVRKNAQQRTAAFLKGQK